jgi:chromosome partitioning protein
MVGEALDRLGLRLGFRPTEGFAERVVFRELFPLGLTALDKLDEAVLGTRPNLSHLTARQEVRKLIEELKLPIDEKGRRRAAARAEWIASQDKPLETDDLMDEASPIAPDRRDATL